jgi:hypothetical protein
MEAVKEWTGRTSQAIVAALRTRVQSVTKRERDRLVEHAGAHWIAWKSRKSNRVFAELRALRGRVQIFIRPGPRELIDSAGLAQRAPRTQGWGWFRSRFEVSSSAQVEPAARLIVQSYEHGLRKSNGGRVKRTARPRQGL